MKPLLFALLCAFSVISSSAQYCAPAPTGGRCYINNVQFGNSAVAVNIYGGTTYSTANNGYTFQPTPAGSMKGNCFISVPYNCQNPNNTTVFIKVRLWADFNNDGDFNDAGELAYSYDNNAFGPYFALGASFTIYPPPVLPAALRVRLMIRDDGVEPTACSGSFPGEAEDYIINVLANNSPTLTTALPFLNTLVEDQDNNEGSSVRLFLLSDVNRQSLMTDADPCAQQGIAVTGVSGANGTWQYKIATGAWTNMASPSVTNTLLLSARSQDSTRFRFKPAGAGTSSLSYRVWDLRSGLNGTYVNTSSPGGTTGYSSVIQTVTQETLASSAAASDIKMFVPTAGNSDKFPLKAIRFKPSTGEARMPDLLVDPGYDGVASDVDLDLTNNKLVWIGGGYYTELLRSNLDGSGRESIYDGFGYPMGLAIGGGKIFVSDYFNAIIRLNLDGSNPTPVTGGPGQYLEPISGTDIEYADNKIYFMNQPASPGPMKIISIDADGANPTELYSTPNYLSGLSVTGDTLYWTEMDQANGYSIIRSMRTGGSVTTLHTGTSEYFGDLQVDVANGKIYVLSQDGPTLVKNRLKSVPITGGSSTRILDLEDPAFTFVFAKPLTTLPVSFLSIQAEHRGNDVKVTWNVAQESELLHYVVERSGDGQQFQPIGTVTATGAVRYDLIDRQPLPSMNYYRVRAVNIDQSSDYSHIVSIDLATSKTSVSVYPALLESSQAFVKMDNLRAGKYTIQVFGAAGQLVTQQTVNTAGGSRVETLNLAPGLGSGLYRVRISDGRQVFNASIIKR